MRCRERVGELLLVAALASTFAYLMLLAFNASEGVGSVALAAATPACALVLVLWLVSCLPRRRGAGYVVVALALLVAFGVAVALQRGAGALDDEGGNLLLALVVVTLSSAGAFALSRTRAGCAVLVVAAPLLACYTELLYQEHHGGAYVLLCMLAIALATVRWYATDSPVSGGALRSLVVPLQAVALGCCALAVGAGVFTLLINPLHPPVYHPYLTTEQVAVQEEYQRGVADAVQTVNPDQTSNVFNDAVITSNRMGTYASEDETTLEQANNLGEQEMLGGGAAAGLEQEGDTAQEDRGLSQASPWLWALAVVALVLLGVLFVAVRLLLRHRWLDRVLAGDALQVPIALYLRATHNLAVLGYPLAAGRTPLEFARADGEVAAAFPTLGSEGGFAQLTEAFVAARYGCCAPDEETVRALAGFQRAFYRRARALVGTRRYLCRWLRLR